MPHAESIADAIERSVNGPMWHGPALRELLGHVMAEQAARNSIPGGHSIWETVLHITNWTGIALRRLHGEAAEPSESENWPPIVDASVTAWNAAIEALYRSHSDLARAVRQLDDRQLSSQAPGRDHTVEVMLRGVVEHAAYHGGQIAVLKRAVRAG